MKQMPFLQFYTTQRCDSQCRHCFLAAQKATGAVRYDGEMVTEEILFSFKRLRECGFSLLALGGAEPTQKPNFDHIVSSLSKMGFFIKIHTNGMSLSKERTLLLKHCNMFEVRISLDGSCAKINDQIRGEGSYDRIIDGLKNCKNAELPFTLAVTLNKINIPDLPRIIDLAYEMGAYAVHSYLLIDKGRGVNLQKLIPEQSDIKFAHQVFAQKRSEYNTIEQPDKSICACSNGACFVSLRQDGHVLVYSDSRASFGEGIIKAGTIFDKGFQEKLDSIIKDLPIPECANCPHFATLRCIELDNYCFDDIHFNRGD